MSDMHVQDDRRYNFSILENEVALSDLLDTFDKMTYWALVVFADNNSRESFPSRKTLAKVVGCGLTRLDKSLARLQEVGLITIETRTDERGGKTSNLYRINPLPDIFRKKDGDTRQAGGGCPPRGHGIPARREGDTRHAGTNYTQLTRPNELDNTTTTAENCGGLRWPDEYYRAFSAFPSPTMVELINSYIEDGISDEAICLIIEKAGSIGAKPVYVTKVLKDWAKAGIYTKEQALEDMQRHEDIRARRNWRPPVPDRSKEVLYTSEELGF